MPRQYKTTRPYIMLLALLLLILSVPPRTVEVVRSGCIATLAPLWQLLATTQVVLPESSGSDETLKEAYLQLQLENATLTREVEKLQSLFYQELRLLAQFKADHALVDSHGSNAAQLIDLQLAAIPAQVIFRSPTSWNSTAWINIGSRDSNSIAHNSPVVVGNAVVGIVDYIGKHQSRVRLISDAGLTPAVRAARGHHHQRQLLEATQQLQAILATCPSLFNDTKEHKRWLQRLENLKKQVPPDSKGWLLAKGEIHGSSEPLWRSRGQRLQGIGFNYDFADDEGPARDLRSGEAVNAPATFTPLPIIAVNDLLVTSGLDGIFPSGLHVGTVTAISPLKEGDYTYSIEATPAAGNLDTLSLVFVLPPMGYNLNDQPPIIGR